MELIKDNQINIPARKWEQLNAKYSKDEIKQIISDAIEDNNLPLPLRDLDFLDAQNDFEKLEYLDSSSLLLEEEWFTRYDYKDKYFL